MALFGPDPQPQSPDDWKKRLLADLGTPQGEEPLPAAQDEGGDWKASMLSDLGMAPPKPRERGLGDYAKTLLGSFGSSSARIGQGLGALGGLALGEARERADMMADDLMAPVDGRPPVNPFRLSGTERMAGRSAGELLAGLLSGGGLVQDDLGVQRQALQEMGIAGAAPPMTDEQRRTAGFIESGMEPGRLAAERWKGDILPTQPFADGGYKDPAYYLNTVGGVIPDVASALVPTGLLGRFATTPVSRLALTMASALPGTLGQEVQEGQSHLESKGRTKEEAIYEATVKGLVSSLPQAALEGATDLKIIDEMKEANRLGRRMLGLGGSMAAGGTEEVLQAISSQATGQAMGLKNPVDAGTFGKQLIDEFAGGAIGGAFLGGGAMMLGGQHAAQAPATEAPTATMPDGSLPPSTVVLPGGRTAVQAALRASLADRAGRVQEDPAAQAAVNPVAEVEMGDATPRTTQVAAQLQETLGPVQGQQVLQVLAARAQGLGMPLERMLAQFPIDQITAMPEAGPQAVQPETAPPPSMPLMEPISAVPEPVAPSAPRPAQSVVMQDEFAGQYPELTPVSSEQGTYMVPTEALNTDPRIQYKVTDFNTNRRKSNKTTSTNSLGGRKYNADYAGAISIWRNPEDNKLYVLNGNNRFNLAKDQGVAFQKARVIKADNVEQASAAAAFENIAEGAGTALDNATFFRNQNIQEGDPRLAELFGPGQAGKVADGLAMAKLDQEVFDQLTQDPSTWGNAAILGKADLSPAAQKQLLAYATDATGRATPAGVFQEMVNEVRASEFNKGQEQGSLFGSDELDLANSNLRERATIIDSIRSKLSGTVTTFQRIASRGTQKALGEMKAEVSPEQARAMAQQAQGVLEDFERNRYTGPINDIINSYATEMQGEKKASARNEIVSRAMEDVATMLAGEQRDSVGEGAVALFDEGQGERPAASITFTKDEAGRIASKIQVALEDGRPVKPTAIFHEIFHYIRQTLTPAEKAWAENQYGIKDGQWTTEAEEKFARDGERWMRDGKYPNSVARSTWSKIRDAFRSVYAQLKGSTLEGTKKVTPELDEFFRRVLGDTEVMPLLPAPPPKTAKHTELFEWLNYQKKLRTNLEAELKKRGLGENLGEQIALLDPQEDAGRMAQYAEIAGNVMQKMTLQELIEAYASLSDSFEGRVLDTDVMRQLNPFYLANPTHMSAIVHEVSSDLTKRLLTHNLQREAVPPPGGGNAFALVTAGGGGSGKGRYLLQEGIKAGADFSLDTTLSDPKKAIDTIEGILASGRDARVVFVYTPLSEATNNMIERAVRSELPRVVRLEAMAKAHEGAPRSILALLDKYGADPRVTIKMAFNGREMQGREMIDSRTAEGREAMRKELVDIAWKGLDEATAEARRAAQDVIDKGWTGYDGSTGDVPKRVAEYLMGTPEPKAQTKAQAAAEEIRAKAEDVSQPEPRRPAAPEQRTLFDEPNPVARKIRHFKSFYRQTGLAAPTVTQQQAGALAQRLSALGLDPKRTDRVLDLFGRWNRVVDRHAELTPVDTALRDYWNTQSAVIHRFLRLQEAYSGMSLNEREDLGLVMDKGEHLRQVFDDETLRKNYKLSDRQIAAYHERLRYFQGIAREFTLTAQALSKTAIDQVKVRKDLTQDQKDTTIKGIKQQLKALKEKFNNPAYVPAIRIGDKQVELWTPEMLKLEEDRKPYLEKLEKWRSQASEAQMAMESGEISEQVGTRMIDKIDSEIDKINDEMVVKGLDRNPSQLFYLRYNDEADLQKQIATAARQFTMRTGETLDVSTLIHKNAQKLQVPGPLIGVDSSFAEYLMEIAHMAVGQERAAAFLANEFPGIVEDEVRLYMAGRSSSARTAGFAGRLMAKHGIMGNLMDAHRVDAHYAATVAREVAVREHRPKIEAAIAGVSNVDLRRYAQEHTDHVMATPDTSEKIVQWIKGIAAFNNLAFKPMYALQQLAQRYTSERPIFETMYARNKAQLGVAYDLATSLANPYTLRRFRTQDRTMLDPDGHFRKAERDTISKWFEANKEHMAKGLTASELIERMELGIAKAEAGGTFDNQVYADIWDAVTDTGMVDQNIARRVAKKLLGAGTYLSGPLEELNRRRTFMVDFLMRDAMAGVRPSGIAAGSQKKKLGLGLISPDNFAGTVLEAQRTVDRLHNAQGRRYYSRAEQKVGSFGALAMQFKAFAIDYGMGLYTAQQALYQDYLGNEVKAGKMTKEDAWRASMKPAAKSMATVMVLGGALGLPMVQQLVSIVAKAFDDPEDDFLKDLERRAIKYLGGGEVAKRVVKSLLWGASNALGYDIGSSFSMGEMFFMPEQGSPAENVVALVLGASGDSMVRYWRAVDALRQGDTDKALSQGLPGFARFAKRGLEGKVEAMGETQRLTGTDRLLHFLGIRSTDTADRYEIANAQRRLQVARQEILNHWGRELAPLLQAQREAALKGDEASLATAQKKIASIREAFRGEAARYNTYSAELGAQDKFKLTLNSLTLNAKNKADDQAGTAVNRRVNLKMKKVWGVE